MTKFHVLYTADHNYFPHMLTSIYSLAENNKNNNIKVHIIEDGFTDEDFYNLDQLNDLYDNIDIKRYNIKKITELMKHFNIPKWRNTDIANARLFSNEIIDETDKILYLDSDTIVVDDLKGLFNKEIQRPLAAVKEILIPSHLKSLNMEFYGNNIESYYNSGVLLFNYDAWDQENCLDDLYSVSKSTISKFVKQLGFEDYKEFKAEAYSRGKREVYIKDLNTINITDYILQKGTEEYLDVLFSDIRYLFFNTDSKKQNTWSR